MHSGHWTQNVETEKDKKERTEKSMKYKALLEDR